MNLLRNLLANATIKLNSTKAALADPVKRTAIIKNTIIISAAVTVGMMINPTKAIGVLVTKMPCLDHENCIVTTVQEFDI